MDVRLVVDPSTGDRGIVWIRFPHQLVLGLELTPLARAALTADAVSGFAFMTEEGGTAVNSDLTLYLHRGPRGEWLCSGVGRRVMREGIAAARASLHDVEGLVGDCVVGAVGVD